jgi:hypothetical protein
MAVMSDLKSKTITPAVEKNVASTAQVDSDDSTSYVELSEVVEEHRPKTVSKNDVNISAAPGTHRHQQCQAHDAGCLSSYEARIPAKLPQ